jgi:UDP-N-acetylglucosamine--N-acetylmuramyl-(pentapeptide) pyrophosphoryl-undecaprenol N-acetylglucosamine transferase
MKIVFTGGGTGGHFYPIIAVAEEINSIVEEKKLLEPKLYYIGPEPYDARALYENNLAFVQGYAGKVRRYFSLLNILDLPKTIWGILRSTVVLYRIYPDVVFSKGGYASFPTLVAARILKIPVVIHESDVPPGRVNTWAGKFAKRIAISYPETAEYFDTKNVALTGNPVRRALFSVAEEGGSEFLKLSKSVPTLLILGGSQGSARINDTILDALPSLVERYQIIHQTGKKNVEEVGRTARFILEGNKNQTRYQAFDFLNSLALRMAAGTATLVISRAGSNAIFEIAGWKLPSIIIPIPENVSHDQRKNAFAYAREGAAVVIEEKNLTPHLLVSEIDRIVSDAKIQEQMREAAAAFAAPDAARKIADEVIEIARSHEREK